MLGSGALIVIDHTMNVVDATHRLMSFYMHESCGKCTPCREGTRWLWQILSRIMKGQSEGDPISKLNDICYNMSFKCFCPLGDAAIAPVVSGIKHFRADYEEFLQNAATGAAG
jgi:NADH-quinone oxidoreductase subunit F